MEIIETKYENTKEKKSYMISVRDLEVGEHFYFFIVNKGIELKNELGEMYSMNQGLFLPLKEAKDFNELLNNSYKAFFFNNTVLKNILPLVEEYSIVKVEKTANRGDIVKQKNVNKKINYYDYKLYNATETLTVQEINKLKEYYISDKSDYKENAVPF